MFDIVLSSVPVVVDSMGEVTGMLCILVVKDGMTDDELEVWVDGIGVL